MTPLLLQCEAMLRGLDEYGSDYKALAPLADALEDAGQEHLAHGFRTAFVDRRWPSGTPLLRWEMPCFMVSPWRKPTWLAREWWTLADARAERRHRAGSGKNLLKGEVFGHLGHAVLGQRHDHGGSFEYLRHSDALIDLAWAYAVIRFGHSFIDFKGGQRFKERARALYPPRTAKGKGKATQPAAPYNNDD